MRFSIFSFFNSVLLALSLLVGCISFVGCSESNDGGVAVIGIGKALDGSCEFANMSDYFLEIEYIPLQTDTSSMVGNIMSFDIYEDKFVIVDREQKRCMLFDNNGAFIKYIGDIGNGKGEYNNVFNISVNGINGEIGVNDFKKMVVYDGDGNFIKSFDYTNLIAGRNLFITEVEMYGDYFIFNGAHYFNGRPYSIFARENKDIVYIDSLKMFSDEVETEPRTGLPKKYNVHSYLYNGEMYNVNGKLDTIYSYNENLEKSARYILDYGKYSGGKEVYINGRMVFEADGAIVFAVYTKANHFSFMPIAGNKMCYLVYNKQSGEIKFLPFDESIKKYGFINDIDGSGMSFLPSAAKGNAMYQFVDACRFIECAERSTSAKMKEVAATLTEESNPVLIKAKLK